MTTKFNTKNTGYKTGYPLFLGQELGIIDTVNVQYPQLEDFYQKQVSNIWNEFEIDLTQDKMDMQNVNPAIVDKMVKTLMYQTAADSVASKSLGTLFDGLVSNPELHNLLSVWAFFETIHARTYSHIIKQTMQFPEQLIQDLYESAEVCQRTEVISSIFDRIANADVNEMFESDIRVMIARTLVAVFALEAIAFMASFAVTFAITETGVFQGIGSLVTLIARDESLHSRFDHGIVQILMKEPEWQEAFKLAGAEHILNGVVEQEIKWVTEYLFADGSPIIGLNSELLTDYILHMAKPVYDSCGVGDKFGWTVPDTNPLPYMDKYIDSSRVQVAPQEIQLTNYKIGAIVDDSDDLNLDLEI